MSLSSAPIITEVSARCVNVPLAFPIKTASGTVSTSPLVLIDLTTNAGITGRAYLFTYTPLALAATQHLVVALGAAIVGQALAPFDIDALFTSRLRLLGRRGLEAMACAGLDMALWDALAIARNVPLVELLGGSRRPILAYDSHSMDGESLGVRRAAEARAQGFRGLKTKIGYATFAEDLMVIRSLKRTLGDEVQLMVDYNQSLSASEAMVRIRALADEGIAWVEEPTVHDNLAVNAQLRTKAAIPLQMGENWVGPEEMAIALRAAACDLAMPDVMKIGGVTGWLRAAAIAQEAFIPMSSHIFQEISAHLLCVTPTAHWLERMDIAGPVLTRGLELKDGYALPSDSPGSGIAWNEEAVSRYQV